MKVIVLDTETANTLDDPLCYDIGWAVIETSTWEVVKTRSFVVAEIFLDRDLMREAYFADKIPAYWEEIKAKKRTLARLKTIRFALLDDCKAFNITSIFAHNSPFDWKSCTLTQRLCTCSKYRWFFPWSVKVCDTLSMARKHFADNQDYTDFCKHNQYLCKNGRNRFTAEILFRFISGNNEFVEAHTGLEDVLIEKEILRVCVENGAEV